MITEIEIEDTGTVLTVRTLNMWQLQRAKRVQGPNRALVCHAFSVGLEIRQYKRLPADLRAQIGWAWNYLINAANTAEPGRRRVTFDELTRPRRAAA